MAFFIIGTQALHVAEYSRISVSEQYETRQMNIYSHSVFVLEPAFLLVLCPHRSQPSNTVRASLPKNDKSPGCKSCIHMQKKTIP